MYSIKNFEPYTLRKHLGNATVLVWSKNQGYQFMSVLDRVKAMADAPQGRYVEFKIIAVEESK